MTLSDTTALGVAEHLAGESPQISQTGGSLASPVIVLSLSEHGYPTQCLMRAHRLASSLRARLHVLRVLPRDWRCCAPRSAGATQRTLASLGATQSWTRQVLGESASIEALTVKSGDFVEQTGIYAAQNGGQLIVVSPNARPSIGSAATILARISGIRVLVAREPREQHTIVAATDLDSADYPVLHEAAEFARWLKAPVVALHQLRDASWSRRTFGWQSRRWSATARAARARELANISQRLHFASHLIVSSGASPTDAILRQARTCEADLVVVGTHCRRWSERVTTHSVCAQIIDRARRSVLVTPLARCAQH